MYDIHSYMADVYAEHPCIKVIYTVDLFRLILNSFVKLIPLSTKICICANLILNIYKIKTL